MPDHKSGVIWTHGRLVARLPALGHRQINDLRWTLASSFKMFHMQQQDRVSRKHAGDVVAVSKSQRRKL